VLTCDVNVLVHAHRADSPLHSDCRNWLLETVQGQEPFAVSDFVLASVVRVSTLPELWSQAYDLEAVVQFVSDIREAQSAVPYGIHDLSWIRFVEVVRRGVIVGPKVSDAYIAAFAFSLDATLVTYDRDFKQFPGLNIREP